MTSVLLPTRRVPIKVMHFFAGLGGMAKGFNMARARCGHLEAEFQCIGGIDVDPGACADFYRLTGTRATALDLMDREQYVAFHGHEPGADWREATADDVRAAAGGQRPNIVALSPPCKGFSGLLSESRSNSAKYQALNRLTLRGIRLALEAWADDPAEFYVLENVPRIATRGRPLLDAIEDLFREFDYSYAETTHDCGELGELAQTRRRFLLVARHRTKVPPFLYEPPKRGLRAVGDVLGAFPLPGDPAAGPMHRMRELQMKTWIRLAFVEAGGDWRSLQKLRVVDGQLADYVLLPERYGFGGALGVTPWSSPAGTVTGQAHATRGAHNVADPRLEGAHHGVLGVTPWTDAAGVVAGSSRPGNGRFSVADPRCHGYSEYSQYGVRRWEEPTGAVTGQSAPGGGAHSVADPRLGEDAARHWNKFRVVDWQRQAGTVVGNAHRPGGGEQSVADPRLGHGPRGPHFNNCYRVVRWDRATGTVTAGTSPSAGGLAVADPRTGEVFKAGLGVTPWDSPSGTITGEAFPSNGRFAVADPRPGLQGEAYKTAGHYGVVPWNASSRAVTGTAGHDNGPFNVADPRTSPFSASDEVEESQVLPAPDARLVAVIRALDGTWHRPFTTLELAALQGLVDPGEHLELEGRSDSAWRERIGNACPPATCAAIGSVMGTAYLLALAGETFVLSSDPIWCRPLEVAISMDAWGWM